MIIPEPDPATEFRYDADTIRSWHPIPLQRDAATTAMSRWSHIYAMLPLKPHSSFSHQDKTGNPTQMKKATQWYKLWQDTANDHGSTGIPFDAADSKIHLAPHNGTALLKSWLTIGGHATVLRRKITTTLKSVSCPTQEHKIECFMETHMPSSRPAKSPLRSSASAMRSYLGQKRKQKLPCVHLEAAFSPAKLRKQHKHPVPTATIYAVCMPCGEPSARSVKMNKYSELAKGEKKMSQQAKQKELKCWLDTNTVQAILRDRIHPTRIMSSRWILTWKGDPQEPSGRKSQSPASGQGLPGPWHRNSKLRQSNNDQRLSDAPAADCVKSSVDGPGLWHNHSIPKRTTEN